MMKIKEYAFTAIQQFDEQKPTMLTWATASYANMVRKNVGEAWDTDGLGTSAGWRRAKKNGVRVVKVQIVANMA